MKNILRFLPIQVIVLLGFCLPACTLNTPAEKKSDPVLVSSVTAGGDFELETGRTKQLDVTVKPDNADNRNLNYRSSRPDVAEVNDTGLVTAKNPGEAAVTVTAADGSGVSTTVRVTVMDTALDIPAAERIFAALKGKPAVSGGWADMYDGGAGVKYADPAEYIFIDDEVYPLPAGKLAAFRDALQRSGDTFIVVSGDIDLSDGKVTDTDHSYFDEFDPVTHNRLHGDITVSVGSGTTVIGINGARIKYGGLKINNSVNVIIRNLDFWDAHGSTEKNTAIPEYAASKASIDALVIQGGSDGVWVDHCTFTDGLCEDLIRNYNHDGTLDIPKGKNVTVSWCEFTNHDKVMLAASSDSDANAVPEDRQITLHHNYFHDRVTQRMPRARGTLMHIYNNYYNNIGVPNNSGYSLGPGYGSQFIVENNYFGVHRASIVKYYDKSREGDETFSRFYHSGNIPALSASNCSYDSVEKVRDFTKHAAAVKPWAVPYSYTPEPAAGLIVSVPVGAGSRLGIQDMLE
ncbi:MAG: Ig-like domain-containing protein [Treponema sp.]|jgi:pectate lyase|nr:Ig-like domain-containing protein [Treponema sp.]